VALATVVFGAAVATGALNGNPSILALAALAARLLFAGNGLWPLRARNGRQGERSAEGDRQSG
jgi:hypothetical protein